MNTDKIYPQVDDVPEDVYREWLSPKPVIITYDSYTGEEIVTPLRQNDDLLW